MPLKAFTRPKESESDEDEHLFSCDNMKYAEASLQLPHDHAPIIIPVKVEEESMPIQLSDIPHSSAAGNSIEHGPAD